MNDNNAATATLEEQREQMKQNRFLAMPLAGTIVWILIGIFAPMLSGATLVWAFYLATGAIFYLGAGLSYVTGERFFSKDKPKNEFDRLFFVGVAMSLLVFAIAMPMSAIDHTTLPLTVGILAGLMWMPFSWIVQHWVGYFHAISRTLAVLTVWWVFPENRFEAVAAVIVFIYVISITVLELRYRAQQETKTVNPSLTTSV